MEGQATTRITGNHIAASNNIRTSVNVVQRVETVVTIIQQASVVRKMLRVGPAVNSDILQIYVLLRDVNHDQLTVNPSLGRGHRQFTDDIQFMRCRINRQPSHQTVCTSILFNQIRRLHKQNLGLR